MKQVTCPCGKPKSKFFGLTWVGWFLCFLILIWAIGIICGILNI